MLDGLLEGVKSFFLGRGGAASPEEKRRLVRLRCHIPVQIKHRDKLVSCLVTDMGIQGLRLRLGHQLKTGTKLPIIHSDGSGGRNQVVQCKVAWCRRLRGEKRFSAGLVYDDTPEAMRHSWVAHLLRELGLDETTIHEQRKHIRAAGLVAVTLRVPSGGARQTEPPRAEMVNLGVGGALLRSRQIVREGTQFSAEIGPFGGMPAIKELFVEVLHCHHDAAGGGYLLALRFSEPTADQVRLLGRYVLALLKA